MIAALAKKFIKNYENVTDPSVRQGYGMLCGTVGIGFNLLLFLGKFFAGLLSGSIAVTADAFNNLSDAGSSIITLLGFRMAGKKPDSDHPFGHGRIEYISGLVVSLAILLMGAELGRNSFSKILHPQPVEFSFPAVAILATSVCVKLYMAHYNNAVGKKIDSAAMRATATDSLSDTLATSGVLVSMLLVRFADLNIDGWCGLLVAALICFAGYKAAMETVSPLMGQPPTPEFVDGIREYVMSYEKVLGYHDLIVHDYGPGRRMVSLHVEVPVSMGFMTAHDMIDNIEMGLGSRLGCDVTIHMDPIDTDDQKAAFERERIRTLVEGVDPRLTFHDFRMVTGPTHVNVIFDVVAPFDFPVSDTELRREIVRRVHALDKRYNAVVKIDKSYT